MQIVHFHTIKTLTSACGRAGNVSHALQWASLSLLLSTMRWSHVPNYFR